MTGQTSLGIWRSEGANYKMLLRIFLYHIWPKSDIWCSINFNDYPDNQLLTKFCAVYTVNAIYANRDKKILTTLMAFNDFTMVLTVVVFCNFFLCSSL